MAAVLAVVINVALGIAFAGPFGLPGLAIAIALAAWIEAAFLLIVLGRHVPTFERGAIMRVLVEAIVAAVAAAFVAVGIAGALGEFMGQASGKVAILVGTALATVAGGVVYVGIALVLRIPELPSIVGLVTDQIRRRRRS